MFRRKCYKEVGIELLAEWDPELKDIKKSFEEFVAHHNIHGEFTLKNFLFMDDIDSKLIIQQHFKFLGLGITSLL